MLLFSKKNILNKFLIVLLKNKIKIYIIIRIFYLIMVFIYRYDLIIGIRFSTDKNCFIILLYYYFEKILYN